MIAGLSLACLFVFSSAQAHESRPAYLELKETAPGQFSVLWRTPVLAGMRLPVALKLPDERAKPERTHRAGTGGFAGRTPLDRRGAEWTGRASASSFPDFN